jgi:hypothetical protein
MNESTIYRTYIIPNEPTTPTLPTNPDRLVKMIAERRAARSPLEIKIEKIQRKMQDKFESICLATNSVNSHVDRLIRLNKVIMYVNKTLGFPIREGMLSNKYLDEEFLTDEEEDDYNDGYDSDGVPYRDDGESCSSAPWDTDFKEATEVFIKKIQAIPSKIYEERRRFAKELNFLNDIYLQYNKPSGFYGLDKFYLKENIFHESMYEAVRINKLSPKLLKFMEDFIPFLKERVPDEELKLFTGIAWYNYLYARTECYIEDGPEDIFGIEFLHGFRTLGSYKGHYMNLYTDKINKVIQEYLSQSYFLDHVKIIEAKVSIIRGISLDLESYLGDSLSKISEVLLVADPYDEDILLVRSLFDTIISYRYVQEETTVNLEPLVTGLYHIIFSEYARNGAILLEPIFTDNPFDNMHTKDSYSPYILDDGFILKRRFTARNLTKSARKN